MKTVLLFVFFSFWVHGGSAGIHVDPRTGLVVTEFGGIDQFYVVLESLPTSDVHLPIISGSPEDALISSNGVLFSVSTLLTFTSGNWDTPQMITVQGVDDSIFEGDELILILTGNPYSDDQDYDALTASDIPDVEVIVIDSSELNFIVSPSSGLITDELGGTAEFFLKIGSQPIAPVICNLYSNTTSEGIISQNQVVFDESNWMFPHWITITGVPDFLVDPDVDYNIVISPLITDDPFYNGWDPRDVSVTNLNTDICGPVEIEAHFTETLLLVGTPGCIVDVYVTHGSDETGDWEKIAEHIQFGPSGTVEVHVLPQSNLTYVVTIVNTFVILGSLTTIPTLDMGGFFTFLIMFFIVGLIYTRK